MSTSDPTIQNENEVNELFQKSRDLEYEFHNLLSRHIKKKESLYVLRNKYRLELSTTKGESKKGIDHQMYVILKN